MMGFFTKKSASAAAPQAKASPATGPIAITGVGLACHAGDQPYALITSILGQISGTELSDTIKVKPANGGGFIQARTAPVAEFAHMPAQQRMITLCAVALGHAAAKLAANLTPEKLQIIIMVDPALLDPANPDELHRMQSYLSDGQRRFETATWRILPKQTGSATNLLRNALNELNEGKWQAILFGGADSLITMDTCLELHEQGRLNTARAGNGLVPGEGAAFVALQKPGTDQTGATPALAWLNGLGLAAEPNARDADLKATEGLASAINQALAQAGIQAGDIQGIVHNLGAETVHTIEWYQTTKKLWQRRVDEQQRMAVQLGEIEQADLPDDPIPRALLPYRTMGELGAAAMPMHLATALAWMEYDAHQARWGFPVRQHLLVCDTPDIPERGAIVMSKTPAATH